MTRFAEELLTAYRAGTRVVPAGVLPATMAEALAVQAEVCAALGPVAGFKVGRKPEGPPVMAPILAARCLPSGARVAVADEIGIELEVGWKIIGPLPAPETEDLAAALGRVVVPVPVIELVDTRLAGAAADDPLAKLADLQVNHGLILGTPLAGWDGSDIGAVRGRMRAGDRLLLEGATRVPGGSALSSLAELYRHIAGHCGGLQPGQVVITGMLHPLTYLPGGTEIAGQIEGIGAVSVTLVQG